MDGTLLERINLLPIAEAITAGDSVFSDEQRQLIEEAYKSLLGKTIPNCSCRHRYADALVEICHTFKITSKMKCRYKLLAGVIIWLGTECYNNHNLTDEVAEEYLKRFPEAREKEFQLWPDDPEPEPEPQPQSAPEPQPEPQQTDPEPTAGEGADPEPQPNPDEDGKGDEAGEGEKAPKKPKGKKGE